jgi:hypothetical protein
MSFLVPDPIAGGVIRLTVLLSTVLSFNHFRQWPAFHCRRAVS